MQEIIIDSCVFFKMIEFNDCFQREGESGLKSLISKWHETTKQLESDIVGDLPDDFKKKYPQCTPEQLIEKYKDFTTGSMSDCIREIKGDIINIVGYFTDGKKDHRPDTPEKCQAMINDIQQKYQAVKSKYSQFNSEYFETMFKDLDAYFLKIDELVHYKKP